MEEKKYLKWYNKIGYGSGDIAGNVVYAFLTSFIKRIDGTMFLYFSWRKNRWRYWNRCCWMAA